MTHLEKFSYPVWEAEQDGIAAGTERYVLFDYSERDPLTKDAHTVIVGEFR